MARAGKDKGVEEVTIVLRRRLIEKSDVYGVGSNRHLSVPAAVFNRSVTHWKKLIRGASGPIRKTQPLRSRAQYAERPLWGSH